MSVTLEEKMASFSSRSRQEIYAFARMAIKKDRTSKNNWQMIQLDAQPRIRTKAGKTTASLMACKNSISMISFPSTKRYTSSFFQLFQPVSSMNNCFQKSVLEDRIDLGPFARFKRFHNPTLSNFAPTDYRNPLIGHNL